MNFSRSGRGVEVRDASLPEAVGETRCETGERLDELSGRSRLLLLFLRHWGCPFCREMLREFAPHREILREAGIETVFVHMGTPERAQPYFEHYGLVDALRISDPEQQLYRHPAFDIPSRSPLRYLGDLQAARALSGFALRNGFALFKTEDITQMPGAFLVERNRIVARHRYRSIADKLDYRRFVSGA